MSMLNEVENNLSLSIFNLGTYATHSCHSYFWDSRNYWNRGIAKIKIFYVIWDSLSSSGPQWLPLLLWNHINLISKLQLLQKCHTTRVLPWNRILVQKLADVAKRHSSPTHFSIYLDYPITLKARIFVLKFLKKSKKLYVLCVDPETWFGSIWSTFVNAPYFLQ